MLSFYNYLRKSITLAVMACLRAGYQTRIKYRYN